MSLESSGIVLIAMSCVWTFIVTPLSLYYAWKFWQYHKQGVPFFCKRHPQLVIISVIGFNIFPALLRPIIEYTGCNFSSSRNCDSWPWYYIPLGNTVQICIVFVVSRLWMLFYDYQHKLNTLNRKWKSEIIHQLQAMQNDWTIRYKWAGNFRIVLSINISISLLFILLGGIFGVPGLKWTQFLPAIWIILIAILVFKIRSCRDEFCIRSYVYTYYILCFS